MLAELHISNFAVIDHLSLQFSSGFQVLTGETGAGKSLLVDAVSLLAGGRASTEHIRSDSEEAILEAAFLLPPESPIIEHLRALDILPKGENELIIRRVLSRSGRNRVYLNGSLSPVQMVQDIARLLIDIHGQHDQQSLLTPHVQLDVLDGFGHHNDIRSEYVRIFNQWRASQEELKKVVLTESERREREDMLRFQFHELEAANLQVGEDEDLTREYHRLKQGSRIWELTEQAYQVLYGQDQSVMEQLQGFTQCLTELGALDSTAEKWQPLLEGGVAQLRFLSEEVRNYRQNLEEDLAPERLGLIDERLAKVQHLKKKYGTTIEGLISQTQTLKEELDRLSSLEEHKDLLRQQVETLRHQVENMAQNLSDKRQKVAKDLEKRIKKELASLRMGRIQFHIQVSPLPADAPLSQSGSDRVEFLLSPNPGEPLKPLARIASGGELSRIMLAIKTVLADVDVIPVLIFDEVDAGIGGEVAAVMGQRLRALGQFHQVFCITHLPQVASQGDSHFLVEKKVVRNRTVAHVKFLDQSDRQEEIARMLAGIEITESARKTAGEMLTTGAGH